MQKSCLGGLLRAAASRGPRSEDCQDCTGCRPVHTNAGGKDWVIKEKHIHSLHHIG